jgi:WD40 repeat protein
VVQLPSHSHSPSLSLSLSPSLSLSLSSIPLCSRIVTCESDGVVKYWDENAKEALVEIKAHSEANRARVDSTQSTHFAIGGNVSVWQLTSSNAQLGNQLALFPPPLLFCLDAPAAAVSLRRKEAEQTSWTVGL